MPCILTLWYLNKYMNMFIRIILFCIFINVGQVLYARSIHTTNALSKNDKSIVKIILNTYINDTMAALMFVEYYFIQFLLLLIWSINLIIIDFQNPVAYFDVIFKSKSPYHSKFDYLFINDNWYKTTIKEII